VKTLEIGPVYVFGEEISYLRSSSMQSRNGDVNAILEINSDVQRLCCPSIIEPLKTEVDPFSGGFVSGLLVWGLIGKLREFEVRTRAK